MQLTQSSTSTGLDSRSVIKSSRLTAGHREEGMHAISSGLGQVHMEWKACLVGQGRKENGSSAQWFSMG